jgi:hypothetical protein
MPHYIVLADKLTDARAYLKNPPYAVYSSAAIFDLDKSREGKFGAPKIVAVHGYEGESTPSSANTLSEAQLQELRRKRLRLLFDDDGVGYVAGSEEPERYWDGTERCPRYVGSPRRWVVSGAW